MAALALQETTVSRHEDATIFVRAFAGSHRYVLDYLMAEVLRRQPPDTRAFLLHTSILAQLSGPLCDAVAGTVGTAQSMLEQLEATNLFLVPLDDRRQWYRYYRLFADFLRAQLKQDTPDLIPKLHQRAAAWLETHDFPHEAVTHALHGEDFERAARLITQLAESLLMHGEVATLLRWLQALPVALVEARPRLIVYYAGAFTIAGRLEDAETYLQKVETVLTPADAGTQTYHEVQGLIAATRAYHQMLKGDLTGAMTLARQAEDNITATSFLTPVVGWLTGFAYYFDRDADAARHAFDETTALSQKLGNTLMATLSLYTYGYLQTIRGHLREAEAVFAQGLQLTNPDGTLPPSLTVIHQGLGDIARERNRLDEAARHLVQSVALAEAWGNAEVLADSYMVQARIMLARGEIAAAAEMHEQLARLAAEEPLAELTQRQIGARRAQFWIATGDLARAEAWASSLTPLDEAQSEIQSLILFVRGMEAATVARLRLVQGRPDDALAQVTPLYAVATDVAWSGVALELSILGTLANALQGNTSAALTLLHKALTLAAPEGYVRLFLDEGEPMQALLAQASREVRDPALASYVQTLLKAFPTATPEQDTAIYEEHDLEPLSERELELLQLIVDGYTNREIAEQLYIAVSTVKSHINNLYGKLNVSNRAQAVTRAHVLELVEGA